MMRWGTVVDGRADNTGIVSLPALEAIGLENRLHSGLTSEAATVSWTEQGVCQDQN